MGDTLGVRMVSRSLRSEKGQTTFEYLLLLSMTFLVAYILISDPIARYTRDLITDIRTGLNNLVLNAEWTKDKIEVQNPKHPGNPQRLKPVHL